MKPKRSADPIISPFPYRTENGIIFWKFFLWRSWPPPLTEQMSSPPPLPKSERWRNIQYPLFFAHHSLSQSTKVLCFASCLTFPLFFAFLSDISPNSAAGFQTIVQPHACRCPKCHNEKGPASEEKLFNGSPVRKRPRSGWILALKWRFTAPFPPPQVVPLVDCQIVSIAPPL